MLTRRTVTMALMASATSVTHSRLAHAADPWTSDWGHARHSRIRLLGGGGRAVIGLAGYAAAIEIGLDTGYKTYWRDPGDSGVPPVFDWSQSENVDRVEIVWPAPFRFPDGNSFSIGYKDRLILPVGVTAKDASKPPVLRLKLDYAVCDKQCIPEQASATLVLQKDGESPHLKSIGEALALAPKRVGLKDNQHGLGLRAITHRVEAKPVLVVEAVAPRFVQGLDLFVEAPNGAFFGAPKVTPLGLAEPGHPLPLEAFRFELPLEQKPTGNPAWDIRLTLVSNDVAVEHSTRLDGFAAAR
ncbi:MAG: protein-disulfide reductase DsbD domain-containing protein [Beijerinckiaceae bacterium]